ncbi:pyrroline-5-carboxylate reductase [Aequitasia blattaphilus]|uniref:Pyrroline-5-carboxylate reductase n=1 Tax=Aequitasia blattaphilus TaxID=2949332 RepID=A0ABT1E550_9FIRM|nr:pyrroline-5-carboxylate reductase [Aequitasia blattaphilus]MCP1100949.1 pyrroline-5-carboxylate reductase [Aequitasia blattaphilus]MCR8613589.1 pyrroline-5-carboxylate reductase [Aequitasia blattaphilus]
MYKLGFIGCGNMAKAMLGGILEHKTYDAIEIIGSDPFEPSRRSAEEKFGIHVTEDNCEVVQNSEIVILSVKPQYCEAVIRDIKKAAREDQLFITIIPGKTLGWLEEKMEKKVKVVRTMPNTPAMVNEGMTGACCNEAVNEEEIEKAKKILSGFGKVEFVPENLMDIVTGVSGSSPAYTFLFIEALADGAVAGGMPRSQAYRFAAQAVLGSAKLLLETGKHPGELKDMVSSPGGTTIGGIRILEKNGFRSSVMEAVLEGARIAKTL